MPTVSLRFRRVSSALVAIVAVSNLAGCRHDATERQAAAEGPTFRAEIDELRSQFEAAVATGTPSAITPLLAEGAVMVRPGGPDWDAMAAVASGAPFPPGAKIAITPIEVVALSEEWAYEFGTAVTTYTPEGDSEQRQLRDTYLLLFRNTGGGWKAFREVASSSPPPSGWPDV